jgi:hypothetical protein
MYALHNFHKLNTQYSGISGLPVDPFDVPILETSREISTI